MGPRSYDPFQRNLKSASVGKHCTVVCAIYRQFLVYFRELSVRIFENSWFNFENSRYFREFLVYFREFWDFSKPLENFREMTSHSQPRMRNFIHFSIEKWEHWEMAISRISHFSTENSHSQSHLYSSHTSEGISVATKTWQWQTHSALSSSSLPSASC